MRTISYPVDQHSADTIVLQDNNDPQVTAIKEVRDDDEARQIIKHLQDVKGYRPAGDYFFMENNGQLFLATRGGQLKAGIILGILFAKMGK